MNTQKTNTHPYIRRYIHILQNHSCLNGFKYFDSNNTSVSVAKKSSDINVLVFCGTVTIIMIDYILYDDTIILKILENVLSRLKINFLVNMPKMLHSHIPGEQLLSKLNYYNSFFCGIIYVFFF